MEDMLPFTVIIPAHNEEAVIARCLKTVLKDAPEPHAMEIIVAANGCIDRTVEQARTAASEAIILDLPEGSKIAAINAANRAATHTPRIYLDADVECGYNSLRALADALLEPGVMTAAPSISLDTSRCNWLMRAYYRAWLRQPYALAGKGGAGCYALSAEAIEVLGEFPNIIADDLWVHTRFADSQRRYLARNGSGRPVHSIVHPPQTVMEQVKVEARRAIGTAQVRQLHASQHMVTANDTGLIGSVVAARKSGASMTDTIVFYAIKVAARLLARWRVRRGQGALWSRDLGSRKGSASNV